MKAIPQVRCPLFWCVSVCSKFIKSNQKGQGFFFLTVLGSCPVPVMVGKSWLQELEAAGHVACVVKKQ